MTTYKINDNGVERDMTADEIAEHLQFAAIIEQEQQVILDAAAAKEAARAAALAKLGLTADEIAALFG